MSETDEVINRDIGITQAFSPGGEANADLSAPSGVRATATELNHDHKSKSKNHEPDRLGDDGASEASTA